MNPTTISEFEEVVRWLGTPAAYPHVPPAVERIETHISCVFLAGDQVYKLKKPVRFDFLDFSTLALREHACREELRLNRRLAAETYIDVVPVTRQADGALQIGSDGRVIDWLVHMRLLPTDKTLEVYCRRGVPPNRLIESLARTLAGFYRNLPPLAISPQDYRQRTEDHVRGNRRELLSVRHHLPQGVVERIHAFQLQLLRLRPHLFDERVQSGRIIEGHGDLRPEHICLTDPPVIFDCIEFNAEFRQLDMADELCFLAAECDFLGASPTGQKLLHQYQELSGDRPQPVLIDFYKSYRACVRAKVAALREDQTSGQRHADAAAEAARHLELADRYCQPWLRPLVLAIGGLSGTGKSTLAGALAEAIGAEVLRTDVIRKELFPEADQTAGVDGGIYRPESRQRVYDEMLARAGRLHAGSISVVLDGTFASGAQIGNAYQIAKQPHAVFLAVECACTADVARQRIRRRLSRKDDASEARPEIHDDQRTAWKPWPANIPQCRVDTEQPLEQQVEQVLGVLQQLWRQ